MWAKSNARFWIPVLAVLLACGITFFIFVKGWYQKVDSFSGAVFASWVGGLMLFVVVGLVAALASIVSPEEHSFDSRARILFRRQTGSHVDYIITKLKTILEHYAEITERKIYVSDFIEDENKFELRMETLTKVCSYVDDIESKFSSRLFMTECCTPPRGRSNRLENIKVDGRVVVAGTEFSDSLEREFVTTILPSKSCSITNSLIQWINADTESMQHRPVRFTQKFSLEIENRLIDRSIKVLSTSQEEVTDPAAWAEHKLEPGGQFRFFALDLQPNSLIYHLKICNV